MKELLLIEITKERILKAWHITKPYIFSILILFYLLPICIYDVGSGYMIIFMITPAICFIISMIYGLHQKNRLFYSLLLFALYVPSTYIYYNPSMNLIGIVYLVLSSMGQYLGENISLVTIYLLKKYR